MSKIAQEARTGVACPLCGREKYCFLIGEPSNPNMVLCQWTEPNRPPNGWTYQGLAKDNRPKFLRDGAKRRRSRKYPELVRLQSKEFSEKSPKWVLDKPNPTIAPGDLIVASDGVTPGIHEVKRRKKKTLMCSPPGGTQIFLEIAEKDAKPCVEDPDTGDQLQRIEYLYPDPLNPAKNIGKVVRRQWSDRRPWFESYTKTKEVRPWFWNEDAGDWAMGRGQRSWPLYRENEAKEAITRGEVLFLVAGEQAVEVYRSLGLTATTCQGGEARYADIPDRLSGAWAMAQDSGLKPLIAIHPDFDLTGDTKFVAGLTKECRKEGIAAVALNPLAIWSDMPHGGDIKDVVDGLAIAPDELLLRLENAIDEAIDLAEMAERNIKRRLRWGAPDSVEGELGYWRKNDDSEDDYSVFRPLTNFDLQIEKEVASSDGGGFILQLKRSGDHHQHRLFLPSLDFTSVSKFEDTLKKSLGGALICRLNNHQMKALLRVRLDEYHSRGGKMYRLAERVGQQADGYWIFPSNQLTPSGEATSEENSRWIWNDGITGQADTLPVPQYNPTSSDAMANLVESMIGFYGPVNIYPALLTLGYGAAAVHYQSFIEQTGNFPILNLIGDGGGGKTTAGACALSISGMHTDKAGGMLKDVSVSAAYERLKLIGGLVHCWDDPTRTPELDEFLKGLYNGKPRLVRGGDAGKFNSQKPHSALMVASNFAAGETNAATMSRLILLWFDCSDKCGGKNDWLKMKRAMDKASGALPGVIKLGLDLDQIGDCEEQLEPYLPHAHSRMARNLAIILQYGNAVLDMAGVRNQFDLLSYLRDKVCSMANDADASTDSLRDFVERLSMFRSQAKLGEWNMRFTTEHNSDVVKALSIRLKEVWDVVDKNSNLAYNKQILKNLLKARGAKLNDKQRFHGNEDVSKAFDRKATDDPIWRNQRCVSIPIDIIREYIEIDERLENMSTASTDPSDHTQNLVSPEESQLTSICQLNVNWNKKRQLTSEEADQQNLATGTHQESQLTVSSCQLSTPVDGKMSTDQNHTQHDLEGDFEPQLTQLTSERVPTYFRDEERAFEAPVVDTDSCLTNAVSHAGESKPAVSAVLTQDSPPTTPVDRVELQLAQSSLQTKPIAPGDVVIPTSATVWYRKGSARLPKGSLPYGMGKEPSVHLAAMEIEGLDALQAPSLVLSVSQDGYKLRIRNQETGRTSIVSTAGTKQMPKRGGDGSRDNT
ncbi:hypothetical protein IQ260_00585 [Leptolyngbya cf. ectocarpi LEGE 11479]|uniref:DUF927 domain-containing protein n=1 Tax=Leptolyngbya cf. ectocarpi LEGE 11479 TaxID=1828722 RepID=A0A928X0A6_LEPEC|nr:hypothetical protein [Leptolyngbya ectocarpi]MBE9065149.1 hypothetical protein [Leptolyngbya cf. ectocarpi LEGE 11479]